MLKVEKPSLLCAPQKQTVCLPITSPFLPSLPLLLQANKSLLRKTLKAHCCFVSFPAPKLIFPLDLQVQPVRILSYAVI